MKPIKVFVSYAHEDESYKDEMIKHLALYKRKNIIEIWEDRGILPGQEWDAEIKTGLQNAEIVLFLMSVDFVNSGYIERVELTDALKRYEQGKVNIVPIIVRPFSFSDFELSKFQTLPKGAKPISKWDDKDEAWTSVAKELKRLFEFINEKKTKVINAGSNTPQTVESTFDTKEIKKDITAGKLDQALSKMLSEAAQKDGDLENQLILLSSRFNSLKREELQGIISSSDANLRRNRLNFSLLEILKEF